MGWSQIAASGPRGLAKLVSFCLPTNADKPIMFASEGNPNLTQPSDLPCHIVSQTQIQAGGGDAALSTQLWLRRLQRENVSEYRSVFGKFKAATDGGNIARLDCVTHYYHFIFGGLSLSFGFTSFWCFSFQLSTLS